MNYKTYLLHRLGWNEKDLIELANTEISFKDFLKILINHAIYKPSQQIVFLIDQVKHLESIERGKEEK